MQAVQIHNGYFLVLKRGEELISTLSQFCEANDVHWAQFQGIGAVEDVQIGYYDLETREYHFEMEPGPFEVANMDGNISEIDENALVHVHAVLSQCDETLHCIGGHIKSAHVALTLEVTLWFVSQPLLREHDEETGLNLINLNQ